MRFFAKAKFAGCMAMSLDDEGLRIAHVRRSGNAKPVVTRAAFYPDRGDMEDMVVRAAKEADLARYQCSLILNPGQYQLLTVDAPVVQPDEIKTAIRWRVKDMIDFHVDDASIDVLEIPGDIEVAARASTMFVVAARNQLIQEKVSLFAKARVPVTVVDIPDTAQRNISALLEPEGRGAALLAVGRGSALLTVSFGGELYLSRRIEVGAEDLAAADQERKSALFDRITLEVQRSLDHFERQFHFISVAKFFLSIPGADSGLEQYLATNLYLGVERIPFDKLLDLTACPSLAGQPHAQQQFLLTLGAGLRTEEKVL